MTRCASFAPGRWAPGSVTQGSGSVFKVDYTSWKLASLNSAQEFRRQRLLGLSNVLNYRKVGSGSGGGTLLSLEL